VILKKLADDHPNVPACRGELAYSTTVLADLHRSQGRRAEARSGYQEAVAASEDLPRAPMTSRYQLVLAFSLRRRGLLRRDEGDAAGAAGDTQRALRLLDGLPMRSNEEWFETACCHATLASLTGPAEAREVLALLKKAVAMCYRNPEAFRTEAALDSLRERDDFRKLLGEIVALNTADATKEKQ
jgi:hypothetical protein